MIIEVSKIESYPCLKPLSKFDDIKSMTLNLIIRVIYNIDIWPWPWRRYSNWSDRHIPPPLIKRSPQALPLAGDSLSVPRVGHGTICNGMGEILTDQTGIRIRPPSISSQVLYQLRYLTPVFEPVWPSHIIINYRIIFLEWSYNFIRLDKFCNTEKL